MKRQLMFATLAACVLALAGAMSATADDCGDQYAGASGGQSGGQNLFYNYYVGGGARGGVPAQLYLSPRPTPPLVGHTYITYQPLRPQEYLYHHQRTYNTYYGGGTKTVTHVSYGGSFFGSLPIPNRDYIGGPHPMSVGGGLYGWQR